MSDITFNCPACQQQCEAPPELMGAVVNCPSCQKQMCVPSASAPSGYSSQPSTGPATKVCPSCGITVRNDFVICLGCGLNFKTGQRVEKAPSAVPLPAQSPHGGNALDCSKIHFKNKVPGPAPAPPPVQQQSVDACPKCGQQFTGVTCWHCGYLCHPPPSFGNSDSMSSKHELTFHAARAVIVPERCQNCGRCLVQMMCRAILPSKQNPYIDPRLCEGCGFCRTVCKAKAIELQPVPRTQTQNHNNQ